MLPRKYRLPLRTELVRVQKEGKLFQGRLFSLLVTKQPPTTNHQSPTTRFGFIISTKVHKKAVKRNRAKRLLSEAIMGLALGIKPDFDIIVLARKKVIEANLEEIRKEIERLFIKAEVID